MANPNTLGNFLKEQRFTKSVTMKEMSAVSGITQSEIHCLEAGKKYCPSIRTIERLSAFYEIPVLELGEMIDIPNFKMEVYLRTLRGQAHEEQ